MLGVVVAVWFEVFSFTTNFGGTKLVVFGFLFGVAQVHAVALSPGDLIITDFGVTRCFIRVLLEARLQLIY